MTPASATRPRATSTGAPGDIKDRGEDVKDRRKREQRDMQESDLQTKTHTMRGEHERDSAKKKGAHSGGDGKSYSAIGCRVDKQDARSAQVQRASR